MSDSGTSIGSLVLICGFSRGLGLRIGVVCIFCSKFGSLASGSGNEVLSVGLENLKKVSLVLTLGNQEEAETATLVVSAQCLEAWMLVIQVPEEESKVAV